MILFRIAHMATPAPRCSLSCRYAQRKPHKPYCRAMATVIFSYCILKCPQFSLKIRRFEGSTVSVC